MGSDKHGCLHQCMHKNSWNLVTEVHQSDKWHSGMCYWERECSKEISANDSTALLLFLVTYNPFSRTYRRAWDSRGSWWLSRPYCGLVPTNASVQNRPICRGGWITSAPTNDGCISGSHHLLSPRVTHSKSNPRKKRLGGLGLLPKIALVRGRFWSQILWWKACRR